MGLKRWVGAWPVYRQLTGADRLGRGRAVQSRRSAGLGPRTADADRVADSVCPYCADSPISRGRLCPKGSASKQLVTGPQRERKVRYRPPYATEWQDLDLDVAMEMVADRVLDARRRGWQDTDASGRPLRRTLGFAGLGGATLDNEENYLIKKLFTALGAIQIENQARI
jgi:formate dehydrogenase major subunit